jgi:hypothetical protein
MLYNKFIIINVYCRSSKRNINRKVKVKTNENEYSIKQFSKIVIKYKVNEIRHKIWYKKIRLL